MPKKLCQHFHRKGNKIGHCSLKVPIPNSYYLAFNNINHYGKMLVRDWECNGCQFYEEKKSQMDRFLEYFQKKGI